MAWRGSWSSQLVSASLGAHERSLVKPAGPVGARPPQGHGVSMHGARSLPPQVLPAGGTRSKHGVLTASLAKTARRVRHAPLALSDAYACEYFKRWAYGLTLTARLSSVLYAGQLALDPGSPMCVADRDRLRTWAQRRGGAHARLVREIRM